MNMYSMYIQDIVSSFHVIMHIFYVDNSCCSFSFVPSVIYDENILQNNYGPTYTHGTIHGNPFDGILVDIAI